MLLLASGALGALAALAFPSAASAQSTTATGALDVTVRAGRSRARTPVLDDSLAGSRVEAERLHQAGVEAGEALRSEPGVQVTASGGFGAPVTATIRGATAASSPVYLGRVRINDDVGGSADLASIPLWLIDRVEVYRGHAPLEADRLGPGGAIFFEPKPPGPDLGGEVVAGSFGALAGTVHGGGRIGALSGLLGVSAQTARNDYPYIDDSLLAPTPPTTVLRTNADVRTVDAWGLAEVALDGPTIEVVANAVRRDAGVPRLALLPSIAARAETERLLGAITLRGPIGDRAWLESTTSAVVTRSEYQDPFSELGLGTTRLHLGAARGEETVAAEIAGAGARLRLRPVLTASYERLSRDPSDVPLDGAGRVYARAALGAEQRLGEATVVRVLASGECDHTGPERACGVLAPSGRIGAETWFGPVRGLATVGRYVRVPTLGELHGLGGVVRGRPDLSPETGTTLETGLRLELRSASSGGWLFADAFAFAREASALIAYARAGQGYIYPYNVGRARVLGGEASIGAGLTSRLRAELNVSLLDARDRSPARTTVNDRLPYRSPVVLAPLIASEWPLSCDVLTRIGAEVRYRLESSRYADPAGLAVIPAQASLDLALSATWWGGHLASKIRVEDILDARQFDVVGYPLPGRRVYLALEVFQ